MTTADLRKKSVTELKTALSDTRKELSDSKRSHAAGELMNPRRLKELRRQIARIETLIREHRERDAQLDKEKKNA